MKISYHFRQNLKDPLKTFRIYEIMIAIICIGIPIILRTYDFDKVYPLKVKVLTSGIVRDSVSNIIKDSVLLIDKDSLGFRTSISDYAYSTNSYLFGMLLCIAAMLFIFNGAVYFRGQNSLQLNNKGKWYNIILGVSLLGVICCPHRDWQILHYLFAIVFFFGNAFVIGLFHNKNDTKKSIVMAILAGGFLLLTFLHIDHFTLFWGEWASLSVIGIHFILEAKSVKL
jgi:hypothetical protein